MNKESLQSVRDVFKRIYSEENREKYRAICTNPQDEDERMVWALCKKFWHPQYSKRTTNFEKFEPNPNLDDATARKSIEKLTRLLDKLGWK